MAKPVKVYEVEILQGDKRVFRVRAYSAADAKRRALNGAGEYLETTEADSYVFGCVEVKGGDNENL